MRNNTKGALLTTGGGICWGLSGSMGEYLFSREGMDSRWLVPIRLGIAGLMLFAWCLAKERKGLFCIIKNRRSFILLFVYGVLGVSLSQFTYFLTIQLSSAEVGTILQDLSPVFILMCTSVMRKSRPKLYEVVCILLAFVGVGLIVTHGNFSNLAVSPKALSAGILCAVCVTVYNMLTKPLTKDYSVTVLQAWSFLMGSLLLELMLRSWTIKYSPSLIGCFGILFVVVVGNLMAFTFYIKGVSYIGPSKGILYGFAEPVTAALVSVFVFRNGFSLWDFTGFICIFVMLVLISVNGRKNEQNI